ncbi:MAG: pre-peptidase C-terminal domain-containing protein, partial [Planctomycetales bacterium]|nr:pre-peptidase C-terminal domain-containing protein [Planctomycetales bacterium]
YLELVDGDGNLLAFNDDAIGFSSIVNYLAAESTTLYAKVSGYGDATGEYRLFVRNARYTDDHSNLASGASEIAIPAELTGEININTDVDWLRFQASSNQPYVIEGTPNDIDGINLELYDANGVPIASSGFASDRGRILFVAAADQDYTLRIAGQDSASEGSYDLSITPLSSVVVGESVTGRIYTSSEIVFFAFEAVAGENYAASAQAITLTDLRMQLFDSSGKLVSQNDDVGDSVDPTILWQASDDTTYFMGVTEVSGETGKFELIVEPLSFADDHANSAENATRLEINSKTKGVLEVTGELDWFTFSAVAGETYHIQTRLGSLAQSELHLVGPDGTTDIETTDVSEDSGSRIVWTPTESGDYFVYVSGEGSGTYDVTLSSYQDDHANSAVNATNLVLGVVASGEILPVADEDWFQFSVYEGDVYQVRAESLSATRMDVRLMDQDGNTELLLVSSNAGTQYWQAPADAVVYLNVSSASIGHYQLFVSEVKSLQIGNEVNGVIGSAAEVDSFQFSAFAGIEYTIQIDTAYFSGSLVTISDLRGNTLTTHDTDYGFEPTFQWTPDRNGRFLISIENVTSNPIGTYSLVIQKNSSVYSEIGDSAATAVPLPINHTVDSAIDFSDDVDWFRFEAEAGQRYTFTTELISLYDSALTIYDQDGNELAYNDDANFNTYASNIRWTAPAAGVFFVEVSGLFGDTGTYRLISSGPTLTGDFDRNGTVNINDLDLLCARLSIGSTADRYDVNGDGAVNGSDVSYMLENVLQTVVGDVNLDGTFDSADLVKIFSAGEYEDSRTDNSVWSTGDWNCDGDFDSSDLIVAFSAGSYNNDATRPISSQTSLNDIAVALLYSDLKKPSSSLL